MAKGRRRTQKKRTERDRRQVNGIDVLPDEILLGVFDFYVNMCHPYHPETDAWQWLVHVCRRWRYLVFGSPRRLNLRLHCTLKRSTRGTLDIWPALPLVVDDLMDIPSGTDNIITALGQSNRVCKVFLEHIPGLQLEEVLAAMQAPFPELKDLRLSSLDEKPPAILDSFLGGSAPRLRDFYLEGIPFPGLPNLLLSATHLVKLWLSNIPHFGYISPGAIVALLSVLSSLKVLSLGFKSPESRPDLESQSPPPPKRSILPVLNILRFRGVPEYLEELLTHIDTPRLECMSVTFFNQVDFHCPRLAQFFNYTPTLRERDNARVHFGDRSISVLLRTRLTRFRNLKLEIEILCGEPDRLLSSVAQVCSPLHVLSTVEDLYFRYPSLQRVWNVAIESTLWLQLLRPFTAVKNLHLPREFAPGIAAALQELVGGRITEVLPGLQNIFVEGFGLSRPLQENIGQFVAARQLSGHLITISDRYKY